MKVIKKELFEYFVYKLYDNNENNDLSKLKILKLLFLTCSASTLVNNNKGLFKYFDNFAAMPFGNIETDMYLLTRENKSEFFDFKDTKVILKKPVIISEGVFKVKYIVDEAIDFLKNSNPEIFNYNAFNLVRIGHLYYSWQFYYKIAQEKGVLIQSIPVESFINERKYFLHYD
jgi:uncharacterized phage-associated protein